MINTVRATQMLSRSAWSHVRLGILGLPHCCLQEASLHLAGCLSQQTGNTKFISVAHGNSSALLVGRPLLGRILQSVTFLDLWSDWLKFCCFHGSQIPIILEQRINYGRGWMVNPPQSYSGSPGLNFWRRDWLSWLSFRSFPQFLQENSDILALYSKQATTISTSFHIFIIYIYRSFSLYNWEV